MDETFFVCVTIVVALFLSSCQSRSKTDQEIIAEYIQDRFVDIDQLGIGRTLSLSEAEAILYCWAYDGGFDNISQAELEEAISVIISCNDEIRDLIDSIDNIDCDDFR